MSRNEPVSVEPLNPRKRERHKAPTEPGNNAMRDGFSRLSRPDPFYSGERQPVGGERAPRPYRKDC